MRDALIFWMAQHLANLIVVAFVIVAMVLVSLPKMIRQALCKHNGPVHENMACHAICRRCDKDLGFIGTWRARKRGAK